MITPSHENIVEAARMGTRNGLETPNEWRDFGRAYLRQIFDNIGGEEWGSQRSQAALARGIAIANAFYYLSAHLGSIPSLLRFASSTVVRGKRVCVVIADPAGWALGWGQEEGEARARALVAWAAEFDREPAEPFLSETLRRPLLESTNLVVRVGGPSDPQGG